MPDLTEIRARAERHEQELDKNLRFFTVRDLAQRWSCSPTTVRAIPKPALPYINLGHGLVRELRRYRLEDVEAYEATLMEKAG